MKKNLALLLILTITAFIVTLGCDTGSNGDDDSYNTIQFNEGWWKYQTDITGSEVTYCLYDSDKTILRAGTVWEEYSADFLDAHRDSLSFDFLKNSVGTSSSTFEFIHFSYLLPSWVDEAGLIQDPVLFGTWVPNPDFDSPYGPNSEIHLPRCGIPEIIFNNPSNVSNYTEYTGLCSWETYRDVDGKTILFVDNSYSGYTIEYEFKDNILHLKGINFQDGIYSEWVRDSYF